MPSFDAPPDSSSAAPIKMLYLGHTGAGKTGSLAALAAAGYNLRLLSLDGEPEILKGYLGDPESPYRKPHPRGIWTKDSTEGVLARCSYIVCTEEYTLVGPRALPRATAWNRMNQILNNWIEPGPEGLKLGNIGTWGPRDVLVIDTFSRVCDAAMNFQLAINGRLEKGPQVGTSGSNDYTAAFKLIQEWLDMLKCEEIKCNVIVVCHIAFVNEVTNPAAPGSRDVKGFPQTVGRAIGPKVGQYFNHALRAKSIQQGSQTKRVIVTNNDENIELKNPRPLKVREQYDLDTGLAEYFAAIRGKLQTS